MTTEDLCSTRYVRVRLAPRQFAFVVDPRAVVMLGIDSIVGKRVTRDGDAMDELVMAAADSVVGEYRMSRKYATLECIGGR